MRQKQSCVGIDLAQHVSKAYIERKSRGSALQTLFAWPNPLPPPPTCKDMIVTRSGKKLELEPRDLILGDVCELTLGMALPADLRIINCTPDMEVDNSLLTGESESQKKDWKPSDEAPSECADLCFCKW